MRRACGLLSSLFLLVATAACDGDGRDLPEDAIFCQVSAQCAGISDEGGMCCSGICVDCWADSDDDGTFDCDDPDYLDGICLPE
jgi:hypothetical protein